MPSWENFPSGHWRHNMISWCPMMQPWEMKVNNNGTGSPKHKLKLHHGRSGTAPHLLICKMLILTYLVEMVGYVLWTPKIWNRTTSSEPYAWMNMVVKGQVGHLLQINTYLPLEAKGTHCVKLYSQRMAVTPYDLLSRSTVVSLSVSSPRKGRPAGSTSTEKHVEYMRWFATNFVSIEH